MTVGKLMSVDERRIRAAMILEYKIRHSASNAAIAKEFNVSENTVDRALSFARKAGLVAAAEDKIIQELVPAAHRAIMAALADTDNTQKAAEIAIKVFQGALPSFAKQKGGASPRNMAAVEDELERHLRELRGGDGHFIIEGQLASAENPARRALPPATPQLAAPRIQEPNLSLESGEADAPASSQSVEPGSDPGTSGDSQ